MPNWKFGALRAFPAGKARFLFCFPAPFGFAAGLTESLTDPINLATSFVPVVGEARVMSLLGKAGSAWGRAGVRAGVGAVEGAAGAALVEPMIIAGKDNLQQEYSFAGSLMNVVFGAGMGAALRPLSGFVGDWKRARRGQRQPWEYVPASDTTEGLRAENAQGIWRGMRESGSEQLAPEHAEAAAALWDATLRGYAYDTGELVEDLYRQYRVEYRGGKLEVLPGAEADGREHVSILDGEGRDEGQSGGVPQMEQAMYRSKSKSFEEFIKEVRSGEITYRTGERSPDAVKKFFGLDELVTNYSYYFIQHLDNRRSEATGSLLNMADDVLADADYIQETGQRKTGEKLYSAVRRNGDGTATLVVFELVKSRKKGNRILPHSAIIENENTIENVVRQKGRASTSTNAGSGPSLLKPLEEDELRVLEALFSKKLSQTGEKGKPLSQASVEGAQGALYQDGEQGTVITVRGDELGVPEGADIREYRKAAREVYRELQKTPAHREDLGEIQFTRVGFDELSKTGMDPRKWQLVPKLKEIVENAKYIQRNELNKVRKDRVKAFYWLEADVELRGDILRVGINIAEDVNGNKFYNLNQDLDAWSQKYKAPDNLSGKSDPGAQELFQDASASIENTIATSTDGVNLYILSEGAQGEAPRARVSFGEKDAFAVVEFFKAADPSSAPHEMYHIFRRIMSELYDDPKASEAFKARYCKACEFVGTEPGKVWTPEQEEKFARAGERFLLEGVAPNARMHDVMESFRQWMGEIYGNAERSGLEISDGMRQVFGDMLGTAEDGDLNFRCALGKLLDYAPERDIDTSFELPDRTPEQALEAYMADAAATFPAPAAYPCLPAKPDKHAAFAICSLPLAAPQVEERAFLSLTAGGTRGSAFGATTPRRLESRHGGGRGAEERTRGARPRAAKLHEASSRQTRPEGAFRRTGSSALLSVFPAGKARCLFSSSLPDCARSQGYVQALAEKRALQLSYARRMELFHLATESFKGREWEAFPAILAGSQRDLPGSRKSVAAAQGALKGYYLGGLVCDLEALGHGEHLKLLNRGVFDRHIAGALWQMEDPLKYQGPEEAMDIARVIHKWQEKAREDANSAGAWISREPGSIVEQTHDRDRMRRAGQDKWIDDIMPRLDWGRTGEGGLDTEAKRRKFLEEAYKDLALVRDPQTSENHLSNERSSEFSSELPGPASAIGAQASRMNRGMSRGHVLHFRTGEAWFDYNRLYGRGNVREAVLDGLTNMASGTALMRVLGPEPHGTLDAVMGMLEMAYRDAGDARGIKKLDGVKRHTFSLMKEVDGTLNAEASSHPTLAAVGRITRVRRSVSRLGGALLSSFSDAPVFAEELAYQGHGYLSALTDGIRYALQGRGVRDQRRILSCMGVFAGNMAGDIIARVSGEDGPGAMARMQALFFKLNCLSWWTDSWPKAAGLMMAHDLALDRNSSWQSLSGQRRRVFERYNIAEAEWEVIRQGQTRAADGRDYLTPDELETVKDEVLAACLRQKGIEPTAVRVAEMRGKLADRLRTMLRDRINDAVLEKDAEKRVPVRTGTSVETYEDELLRWIMQFKSFSAVYRQRGLGRFVKSSAADSRVQTSMALLRLVAMTTAFGYISMAAKDLARGRTPRDPKDRKTWLAAFIQGGGAGLYGDFIFGDFSRFGGEGAESLPGQAFSSFSELAEIWSRMREDVSFGQELARFVQNNTPGSSLLYVRAAMDYLLMYNVYDMMKPGYFERMKKRAEKENNRTVFLNPPENRLSAQAYAASRTAPRPEW